MNGSFLVIPFLLIRFGLLSHLGKDAVKRAAHFPPISGHEIAAHWIYQLSNVALLVYLFFLKVIVDFSFKFYVGLAVYLLGLILCTISIVNFAAPSEGGLNFNGLYRFSRNPMYVAYFVYFIGCALLTHSLILGGITFIFQITSHWLILSEERWCIATFGDKYKQYMKTVRRYL